MGLLQNTSSLPKPESVAPGKFTTEEIPVPVYQFAVEIDGETVALFQNVTGMSVKRDVESVPVGGENSFGREFPGRVSYGHITLEVGLSSSDFFWKWMTGGHLDGYAISKDVTLIQRRPQPDPSAAPDEEKIFQVVKYWFFDNAFPVGWKISDLNLDNSENIVIESLELSFDSFSLYTTRGGLKKRQQS